MNTVMTIIALRCAALAMALTGHPKAPTALYQLADLLEAGVQVDAHMQRAAEILKQRDLMSQDWDAVDAAIQADFDAIMAEDPANHPE